MMKGPTSETRPISARATRSFGTASNMSFGIVGSALAGLFACRLLARSGGPSRRKSGGGSGFVGHLPEHAFSRTVGRSSSFSFPRSAHRCRVLLQAAQDGLGTQNSSSTKLKRSGCLHFFPSTLEVPLKYCETYGRRLSIVPFNTTQTHLDAP